MMQTRPASVSGNMSQHIGSYAAMCIAERERVSVTNFASTMVTLLVSNPLLPQLDLSCLRLVSSGGSPLPPAIVKRAISAFRCPFFISYGMTECCGKISMSILPKDCSHLRYEHAAPCSLAGSPVLPAHCLAMFAQSHHEC